nr:LOW QUALITY PROTEIN: DNA repair protein RAD50-like [Dermatophagoides farinae]
MTHLQRLSIQGIRSFNPNEPQEIRFLPLTIILGPNGAGKTSIIESLKYVTTGVMPPYSNSGKTFIHDVQFMDNLIVRGQIRLQFTDVEAKSTIITRSMQATLKYVKDKPQITFRQINAVIKRGNRSIDQKFADINAELIELIGVSKAILNNVIFCHQEDIHWPLSEGKMLKEKFDDIFGSIGFTKALESIKKLRDEEMINLRLLEKDVIFTEHIRKEVDQRRKQLAEEESKIKVEKEKIRNLDSKINQLDSLIADLIENEQYAEMMSKKISELIGSIDEKQKYIDKIDKNCRDQPTELMQLNRQQIDERLANFDSNFRESKSKKNSLELRMKKCCEQYDQINREKSQFSYHQAQIDLCRSQLAEYFDKINPIVTGDWSSSAIQNDYENLDHNDCKSVKEFFAKYSKHLHEMIENSENSFENRQRKHSKLDAVIKEKFNELKNEKDKIMIEIEFRRSEIRDSEAKIEAICDGEMKNAPENLLTKLNQDITNLETQLTEINQKQLATDSKMEIDRLEMKKKSLGTECDTLKKQIAVANENQQRKKFYDYFQSQKQKIEAEMATIKMNNFELFNRLSVDVGNFSEKLSQLIDKKRREDLDKRMAEIKNVEQQLSSQTISLKNQQELLDKNEKQLVRIKEKLNGVCTVEEFNDYRLKIENDLNELRKKNVNMNISQVMDEYVTIIEEKQECPFCGRSLDHHEVVNFSSDLCDYNPEKLEAIEAKITTSEQKHNQLMLLRNEIESIPEIEQNIRDCNEEIEKITANVGDLQKLLTKYNTELDSIKTMIDDWQKCLQQANKYDNLYKEYIDLNAKQQTYLQPESDERNLDLEELNCQLQRTELDVKSCDLKLSKIQADFLRMTEEKSKLQNLLQLAERNRNEHLQKEQNQMHNIRKRQELIERIEQNEQKLNELETKLSPIDQEIKTLQIQLCDHRENWQKSKEDLQHTIQLQQNSLKTLKKNSEEIEKSLTKLRELQSKISQDYLDDLDKRLTKVEVEKKQMANDMNVINEMIVNFELNKRQLLDRQILLNLQQEIHDKETELKEFKDKIGSSNITTIREKRIRAERERQAMATHKESSKTKILDLVEKIKKINDEMANHDEYRNANKNYREKCIDKVISELACEDLDKFYKALDNTITMVHTHKMEDINKLIDQFWRVSYQGEDIESIQIMVDQGERSASARRRTYNYRVVMIQQGKTLDMRGRCSAGQKVLACIIIRIALALLFSNNFTVITLDEPTTNLDNANIRALAKAIVKLRKMNQHLQIVIITHDEDFLQCLSADDYVDQYYRVYKNDEGYSTIELSPVHSEELTK